jgi:hypothetical protein
MTTSSLEQGRSFQPIGRDLEGAGYIRHPGGQIGPNRVPGVGRDDAGFPTPQKGAAKADEIEKAPEQEVLAVANTVLHDG